MDLDLIDGVLGFWGFGVLVNPRYFMPHKGTVCLKTFSESFKLYHP